MSSKSRWSFLAEHVDRLAHTSLRDLLPDAARGERLRRRAGPLLLDVSRQKLDNVAFDALGEHIQASGWQAARDAMFAGQAINTSEQRAVLHTALRAGGAHLPALAPPHVRDDIERTLRRMGALVEAIEQGDATALGIAPGITDVLNIGIGGSDLGPRLASRALEPFHVPGLRSHFLTNVDGQSAYEWMHRLDPKRTLVIMVSKTFTTQETLLNGNVLRAWVRRAYGGDAQAASRHFLAVSANLAEAQRWGVPAGQVYPMWDFVGGRFSLWSAVGLSLALVIGMYNFRALLAGAALMDDHFRSAPWQENLPVLLALVDLWNRNGLGYGSRVVVPYADLLADLPPYLQQLEMESLGKQVTPQGQPVAQATAPVVWGSAGTNAQHAYFQALHQGTDIVPVEFIGVTAPAHNLQGHHHALLANLLAQAAALALGKPLAAALAESGGAGDPAQRQALAAQRSFPGDRPSTVILLDALTPQSLGALIALYEHKVFMLGHLWGINAFDQWGVELGKSIAKQILPALSDPTRETAGFDTATQALIEEIRAHQEK